MGIRLRGYRIRRLLRMPDVAEDLEVCEICGGTGVVEEYIYDPDCHQLQPTGTKPCICQLEEKEENLEN